MGNMYMRGKENKEMSYEEMNRRRVEEQLKEIGKEDRVRTKPKKGRKSSYNKGGRY